MSSATDFRFAAGTPFPPSLAGAVGKELLALRDSLGHGPVPEDVLTFAKAHRESAIAQCFDWDRDAAAEAHWLTTAGHLLRAVRIQYVVQQKKGEKEAVVIDTRLMQRVTPDTPGIHEGKVYLPAMEVLPNFHYRTQLIEGALLEVDRWRNRHAYLTELDIFFRKLEEADRAFGRKPDQRESDDDDEDSAAPSRAARKRPRK